MGVPAVPLAELYSERVWQKFPRVSFCFRTAVERFEALHDRITAYLPDGSPLPESRYVLALPFERARNLLPETGIDFAAFSHVPITGIHLWFDRPITSLPHATLLDRTIQWLYNKGGGRHVQLVVSASRDLTKLSREEVTTLALKELAEFFPIVKEAQLERTHVVKEMRATFSAGIGLEAKRPQTRTRFSNLFLAGDWTRTGWPSTMEGAVRSGYLAAEAILDSLGTPRRFLLPD
jgi:zeta-carotene desaturase